MKLKLTHVDNFEVGDMVEIPSGRDAWLPSDRVESGMAMRIRLEQMQAAFERMQGDLAHLVIQHVDRERGVITFAGPHDDSFALGDTIEPAPPPTGITIAVATVATTVLALEFLRRRKQLVAAEDPDSVIRDFVAWFEGWIVKLREMVMGKKDRIAWENNE